MISPKEEWDPHRKPQPVMYSPGQGAKTSYDQRMKAREKNKNKNKN
jgi:hypothetical protein